MPTRPIIVVVLTSALLLAGCAGSSDDDSQPAAEPSTPARDTAATETATENTPDPTPSPQVAAWVPVSGDVPGPYDGLITTGKLRSWLGVSTDIRGEVTIGADDVARLEAALPAALRSRGDDAIADRLDEYSRWYLGAEFDDGAHTLAWFSCLDEVDPAATSVPFSEGGGDCFFSADYVHDSGEFVAIRVNDDE